MAADQQHVPRHAGQVIRPMLLRRNIVIDAEPRSSSPQPSRRRSKQIPLPAAAPRPTRSSRRLRAAALVWHRLSGPFGAGDTFVDGITRFEPSR